MAGDDIRCYSSLVNRVQGSISDAAMAAGRLARNESALLTIVHAGEAIANALANGGRVFACGNGGSMADAMHFCEELTGRYRGNRRPLAAIAISDPTHISCVANDYGYAQVFSRYIMAHGQPGDVLVAISTSGTSQNVQQAIRAARELRMEVVGLSSQGFAFDAERLDHDIRTGPEHSTSDRVQELHMLVLHILVEVIEAELGVA